MKTKVISFKAATYEKQYKKFYSDINNRNYAVNCFFNQKDVSKKIKVG